jgi:hypothetical protein
MGFIRQAQVSAPVIRELRWLGGMQLMEETTRLLFLPERAKSPAL